MGKADEERLAIGVQKYPMKANVQSVVVSFVQNERNTLSEIDVIHLLICDKDRIFSFLEDHSYPKFSACVFILHFVKHY